MKAVSKALIACTFAALAVLTVYGHEAFHGPTELIYHDPVKTAEGYVMFSVRPRLDDHELTYLINMEGQVVHTWKTITPQYAGGGYFIEKTARLTEKGSIVQGIMTSDPREGKPESLLQELDWEGNLLREFVDPREGYLYHHNFKRIWNNHLNDWTIIFTSQIPMSQGQAVAAGADPALKWDAAPDGVVEMDMEGNIVWEWWTLDHVVQDKNAGWPNYGVIAEHPEKMGIPGS